MGIGAMVPARLMERTENAEALKQEIVIHVRIYILAPVLELTGSP